MTVQHRLAAVAVPIAAAVATVVGLNPTARHWLSWQLSAHIGAPVRASAVDPLPSPGPVPRLGIAGDVGTGDPDESATPPHLPTSAKPN